MGSNCFGERKKEEQLLIGGSVSIPKRAAFTDTFGEALQDARCDSGEQGIISGCRKIKGQGKITGSKDEQIWENG